MKLQVGIRYRCQRKASVQDLEMLLGRYCDVKTDISGDFIDGSLLMAYRGNQITPEEDREVQPFRLGPFALTFDGRLDNREEIAERAEVIEHSTTTDPVLILNAYAKLGESIFPHLIGEFALVLWHGKELTLDFVRSIDGARPLFYVLDNDRLIWGSDFTHLVCVSKIQPKVNDTYMLEYLAWDPDAAHTPFSNVGVFPPGKALRFRNNLLGAASILWDPSHIQPISDISDAECEKQLSQKMAEAVRVRLRAKTTVCAELSGGLDSTAIVLLADQVLCQRHLPPKTLRTISCVYNQSETCDEQYFIHAVEEQRRLHTIQVSEEDQKFTIGLHDPVFRGLPNPFDTTPGRFPTIAEYMRQCNARVLLTGIGGDHIFCSNPDGTPLIADHLFQWHLRKAHHECAQWSRFSHVPYFRLFFSQAMALALGSFLPSTWQYEPLVLPSWLLDKSQRLNTLRMLTEGDGNSACMRPSHRFHTAVINSLVRSISQGRWNAYQDIYVSHPYSHRPLIEFCLAAGMSQFLRRGETRSLIRRSLATMLPARILKRKGKGSVLEAFARALSREWSQIGDISRWQICQRGYADAAALRESLQSLRFGLGSHASSVVRALTLERWFRSLALIGKDDSMTQYALTEPMQ